MEGVEFHLGLETCTLEMSAWCREGPVELRSVRKADKKIPGRFVGAITLEEL